MNELFAQLAEATGLGRDWFSAAALVFLRIGAILALMPAFGEQVVPQRVRLVLTLSFTAITAPAVFGAVSRTTGLLQAGAIEVLVGLAIGLGLRLFIMALQMSAAIIAQVTSLSQLFAGSTPEPQPAIGNLLTVTSLALAVICGLHIKAASLIILSYQILPAGHWPSPADMSEWGLGQIGSALSLALALSAPFVIGSVIYNVALGVINKAMPQLAVSLVGAPVLTCGALVLMAIIVPMMLSVWLGSFDAFLSQPFRTAP